MSVFLWLATGAAAVYAVDVLQDALDRRRDRTLAEVYRREQAMMTLARFTDARRGTWSQWDRCASCRGHVLVENTTRGVCADCLSIGEDVTRMIADQDEWADIQRAIDDENAEGEDHR